MKKVTSQILLAIVCAFLGFLLAHQFKMLNEKNKANMSNKNLDILSEIEVLKKEKEELTEVNTSLSDELKQLEEKVSQEGTVEAEIKKQLDNARMNLGLVDVKGPGIIITITPKSNIFGSSSDSSRSVITEDEIVHVVNSLRYIKAEALSVNDYRLTPQTGIKNSGNWIWVGTAKIDPKEKITIKVIGDKQALSVAANFQGVLDYGALQNYYCDVKESDEIVINKTTQSLKNEYIKPVE
ncbi:MULTISPECIES: DUF881 domain-containing protein [unclassified Clostridium]|uniref:DUF881 domain-containing protein n=1 Tax=unclassified Clostridium TaxID=2614128 RepID=UPI002908226E|nr:DUF881 domain-containing protein [Clostridium sp.]MDU5105644.1 DUF881 domain-containing protein [Clostridium sp.]